MLIGKLNLIYVCLIIYIDSWEEVLKNLVESCKCIKNLFNIWDFNIVI